MPDGMTSEHLPEGTGPEAFLRDADLVAYHEREAAAKPDDASVAWDLAMARKAAALTEFAIEQAEADERVRQAAAASETAAFEAMTPKEQEAEVLRKFRESRKVAP
jgi:hypothetical protein